MRLAHRIRKTIPIIVFRSLEEIWFAKRAAIFAPAAAQTAHIMNMVQSVIPATLKCTTAPSSATRVMIMRLVPREVLISNPSRQVRSITNIIPPPAPKNPHIAPTAQLPAVTIFFCRSNVIVSGSLASGKHRNFTDIIIVHNIIPCPKTDSGVNDDSTLPAAVNTSAQTRILPQNLILVFFLLIKVMDEAADEKTSTARAIPIASYAGKLRYAMSTGDIIMAAEIPANPVPAPAANPINMHKTIFISIDNHLKKRYISIL